MDIEYDVNILCADTKIGKCIVGDYVESIYEWDLTIFTDSLCGRRLEIVLNFEIVKVWIKAILKGGFQYQQKYALERELWNEYGFIC